MLHKSYFDTGFGLMNYPKYLIGFFALASRDVKTTMIIGVIFAILCYVLGFLYFKFGWIKASNEVGNQYNLFVKEMRKHYKKRKI